MKKSMIPYITIGIIVISLVAIRPFGTAKKITRGEFLMDTRVEGIIYTKNPRQAEEVFKLAFQEMHRYAAMLDRHLEESEVSLINEAAGREAVRVSTPTADVISRSLEVGKMTEGAFDITVAPLLRLWDFGAGEEKVPTEEELSEAIKLVDFRQVDVDEANQTVFIRQPGAELDLGGIAKGYIVDKAVNVLREVGITSASVDAGGDIRVIGGKPDGSAWRIGIRHPRDRRDIIAVVELRDSAIVTSGDYERYFLLEGTRYHHILDPETGMPAWGLISVTVVAPDAFTADALSTAVFVLGLERGMALIESLPGIDAILIDEREEVYISSGLEGKVELRQ